MQEVPQTEKTPFSPRVAKLYAYWMAVSYHGSCGTLYGTNDNFHPENSHLIPALLRRFLKARLNKVATLATGKAMYEFRLATTWPRPPST